MSFASGIREISPRDLQQKMESKVNLVLLDVREPNELAVCKLPGITHIPLGELPARLAELNPYKDAEVVVYCRSGKRSERACQFLSQAGFNNVLNLHGGILAWVDVVDPTMSKY